MPWKSDIQQEIDRLGHIGDLANLYFRQLEKSEQLIFCRMVTRYLKQKKRERHVSSLDRLNEKEKTICSTRQKSRPICILNSLPA